MQEISCISTKRKINKICLSRINIVCLHQISIHVNISDTIIAQNMLKKLIEKEEKLITVFGKKSSR